MDKLLYDLEHHRHHIEYYIHNDRYYKVIISQVLGSGVVRCRSKFLKSAVKYQLVRYNNYNKHTDYIVATELQNKSKVKINKSTFKLKQLHQLPIQVGANYEIFHPITVWNCNDVGLYSFSGIKDAIIYTEPIIEIIKECALSYMLKNPTENQKTIAGQSVIDLYNGHLKKKIKPTYEQFVNGYHAKFGLTPHPEIQSAVNHITPDNWLDDRYQIPILLNHLYGHAFAHNGVYTEEDVEALMQPLGGLSTKNAHYIYSLLHIYDSLYTLDKQSDTWQTGFSYLEDLLTQIDDSRERNCYFRLLNKKAGNFLIKKDGSYVLPYMIESHAIPDKKRQYSHKINDLYNGFSDQLSTNIKHKPTGLTSNLPNT